MKLEMTLNERIFNAPMFNYVVAQSNLVISLLNISFSNEFQDFILALCNEESIIEGTMETNPIETNFFYYK